MRIRTETIVTGMTSTIAAAALIGVVMLLLDLSQAVEVDTAVSEDMWREQKAANAMMGSELLNHASRIGYLESRTAVLESRHDG